jgi:hypothetical protein
VKRFLRALSLVVVAVAVVGLWVTQCSGPQPVVVGDPTIRPPAQAGQPYEVEATVANTGPGHGQVQVTFRLRDTSNGRAYERLEQAALEPGERTRVVAEFDVAEADYTPEVEVQYPSGL